MSGRGDVLAGSAFVRLYVKDDMKAGLSKAMGGMRASLNSVATSLAGPQAAAAAGAVAIAGMVASIKSFSDTGSQLNDMAGRTGASAEQLQHWTFAAKQSGASAEDLEKALKAAAKNGVGPGEFERVGKEIASIKDPAERSAKAQEMFGKSGTKLLPMLSELNSLTAQSKALGPIMTDEQVRAADALGDSFSALMELLKRLANQFGATLGPHLTGPIQTAIGMIASFNDAINNTSTDFSGDLLDRLAQFRSMTTADFQKRGSAAAANFDPKKYSKGGDAEGEAGATGAMEKQVDILKTIFDATRRRMALAGEFANAEERHAAKMEQFHQAMMELHRNKVMDFIKPQQYEYEKRALTIAMQRADAAERERIARLMAVKPEKEAKAKPFEAPKLQFEQTATTSAVGAALMAAGSSGTGLARLAKTAEMALRVNQKQLEAMARVETAVRDGKPRAV